MGRYLVTGCAGFIGSHLSEALVGAGDEVVGIDSFTSYYPRRVKEANIAELRDSSRFTLVKADLTDAPLRLFLDGIDAVFHLAAQPGVRQSWGRDFNVHLKRNLLASQRIFEAAAQAGLRVVFASSSSVYGEVDSYPTKEESTARPISPYGVSKLACEQLAHAYASLLDLDFVALRYFTVYGPRQRPDMAFTRIISSLIEGSLFHIFGSGNQSRDFTYVADAVAATRSALRGALRSGIYNVGGGTEATLRDVISRCEHLTGRTLDRRFERIAPGDVRRTRADTTRISAELGWKPTTDLDEGLAKQIEFALSRKVIRRRVPRLTPAFEGSR